MGDNILLKSKSDASEAPVIVSFCTDMDKRAITDNCKKRGWTQVKPSDKWNLYFSQHRQCKDLFKHGRIYVLNNDQLINHFPNSYLLTRNDFLPYCVYKYAKKMQKVLLALGESKKLVPKLIPTTYILPRDYKLFAAAQEKNSSFKWITKACNRSDGSGVYFIKNMKLFLSDWKRRLNSMVDFEANITSYVVSKYISKPLLIYGRQFQINLYVVVTTYGPLKAYLFKHGLCRFYSVRYYKKEESRNNPLTHITNVYISKHGKSCHGGIWSIQNLKLYLDGTYGKSATSSLFRQINESIVHALKAFQGEILPDLHCFEIYSYSIQIDSQFKPWLIAVNASPSLNSSNDYERILKTKLFDNVLSLVIPPSGCPDINWDKCPSPEATNEFELLIDEKEVKDLPRKYSCILEGSKLSETSNKEHSLCSNSNLKATASQMETPNLSKQSIGKVNTLSYTIFNDRLKSALQHSRPNTVNQFKCSINNELKSIMSIRNQVSNENSSISSFLTMADSDT